MNQHRFFTATRLPVMAVALFFAWTVAGPGAKFARGQGITAQPASATRDQLYQELAQEVAALERQGALLKKVVQLVKPTVVHIEAEKAEESTFPSARKKPIEEAGSGVIILHQDKNYVLTNRHVIKNSALNKIRIKLADGRQIYPTKVWSDIGTDVAVMAVAAPSLTAARLGDSSKLEIGDFVLAVGSPFGLSHSVTFGIISAKGRRDLQLGDDGVRFQDFLQTDAAINPGNSGGPLMNLRGEVVGINTAIASSSGGNEGIGFSIPINMVMHIATQLVERGSVSRAYLGVRLDSKFGPEAAARLGLPRPQGASVIGITPKSPAEIADLRAGDVILEFDGARIDDDNHLISRVSLTPVNNEVDVLVFRDGKPITVKVKVGDRQQFEGLEK
jgi:serine protease Do